MHFLLFSVSESFLFILSEAFFTIFDIFVFVFDTEGQRGMFSLCELTALLMCFTLLSIVIFRNVFHFLKS